MQRQYIINLPMEIRHYVPLGKDQVIARNVADLINIQAQEGTMVERSPENLLKIYKRKNGVVLMDGEQVVAHAAKTHTYRRLFKRNVHEIGAVIVNPKYSGNGYAKEIVIDAIEQQLSSKKRMQRLELRRPQIIAMVQIYNLASNSVFTKLGPVLLPTEVPAAAYVDSVGTGENSHAYNTYDITNLGRRNLRVIKN